MDYMSDSQLPNINVHFNLFRMKMFDSIIMISETGIISNSTLFGIVSGF